MKYLLLSLLATNPAISAQAEEHIQITGTRLEQNKAIQSISVDRQTIAAANPANMVDLLSLIPQIQVVQNGTSAGQSYILVRGGEPNFTLVMVDGIPVNDPTGSSGGGFDLNIMSPQMIERIEVQLGGVSAIYGGEALSGAINLITRKDAVGNSIAASYDEFGRSVTLSSRFDTAIANVRASASHQKDDFDDLGQSETNQVFIGAGKDNAYLSWDLTASYSSKNTSSFPEDSGGETYAVIDSPELKNSEQWVVGYTGSLTDLGNWQPNIKLSWSRHDEYSDHPGIAPGMLDGVPASQINSKFEEKRAEISTNYSHSEQWQSVVGTAFKSSRGSNEGNLDYGFPVPVNYDLTLNVLSVFAETKASIDQFNFSVGVRWDEPNKFSTETSWRLAVVYNVTDTLEVFSSSAEGYKTPSFFALAHPLVGNPNLLPERSKNFDIGFNWRVTNNNTFSATLFDNTFKDLVDFDPELFTSVNRSKVGTKGAEFNFQYSPFTSLFLDLNATYLSVDSDVTLRKRPKWRAGANLQYNAGAWQASYALTHSAEYLDSSVATGSIYLPAFSVSNIAVSYSGIENTRIAMNVDDLFDKQPEYAVGFFDVGRRVRLSISYQF